MLRRLYSSSVEFIPRYTFPDYHIPLSDFKGHQVKALKKFESMAPQINMILELRDIRAPLSTRNILFDKLLQNGNERIKRLIVYTKRDSMKNNRQFVNKLKIWHAEMNEQFLIVDARSRQDMKNLLKIIHWNSDELAERGIPLPSGYRALVAGMPNVGKSTLVNSLRSIGVSPKSDGTAKKNTKVARTGNEAGVTRSTSECIRITDRDSTSQGIYLIDTPGIGLPGRASNQNRILSQALCGSVKQNLVDPIIQADFLLFLMNLQSKISSKFYPDCSIRPTNDIYDVLNRVRPSKKTADIAAAMKWVNEWRKNSHGIVFDSEMLLECSEFSYKEYVTKELEKLGDMTFESNDKRLYRGSKMLFI